MPKNPRADETIVHSATSKGTSFRVTIPAFIIGQVGLKKGSILRWKIIEKENGENYLKVWHVKQNDGEK